MAIKGIKISKLTGIASPNLGAVFPIVDTDGNNYKFSIQNLSQLLPDSITNLEDAGANIVNSSSGTGYLQWDNIRIDGNVISSTTGDLFIEPTGALLSSVEDDIIQLSSEDTSGFLHRLSIDRDTSSLFAYSNSSSLINDFAFVTSETDGTAFFSEFGVLSSSGIRKITASDSGFIVLDSITNKGLEYSDDYSSQFTANSLVTKSWVESQLTTSGIVNLEDSGDNVVNSSSGTGYFEWDDIRIQDSEITSPLAVEISTTGTNASITLTPNGTGVVRVPSGYESNVSLNEDLINKKWVDDNIYNQFDVNTPSSGEVLTWDGNNWVNQTLSTAALTAADIGAGTFSGSFTFDSALTIGAITFPATDGTSGQILKTDGSGNLTWSDDEGGVENVSEFNGGTFGAGAYTFPSQINLTNGLISTGVNYFEGETTDASNNQLLMGLRSKPNLRNGAYISFYASENHTGTGIFSDVGTEIRFATVPNGNSAGLLSAIIQNNGNWDFQSNTLTNVADPTNNQDVATKKYVDDNAGADIGTNDQIPFSNLTGDNFDYNSNFTFNGSEFNALSFSVAGDTAEVRSLSPRLNLIETDFGDNNLSIRLQSGVIYFENINDSNVVQSELLRISTQTGSLQLSNYGSGTNTGTATYSLAVDASGNMIEEPVSTVSSGTFTPTIQGSGLSYSPQIGEYVKVNDMVTVYINIEVSAGSPGLSLSGLPFPIKNSSDAISVGTATVQTLSGGTLKRCIVETTTSLNPTTVVFRESDTGSQVTTIYRVGAQFTYITN